MPVFGLLYHLPVINLFRGASRHAFEMTLGISVLAAYGWDTAWAFAVPVSAKASNERWRNQSLVLAASSLLVIMLAGLIWVRDTASIPLGEMEAYYYPPNGGLAHYALWKSLLSALCLFAVWHAWKVKSSSFRTAISLAVIALACFFEPSIMAARWWWPTLKAASRFTVASPTTRFLQTYPPMQNRVYSFVYPWIEEHAAEPRLEPSNLTMPMACTT
jgi:hypothetical protein